MVIKAVVFDLDGTVVAFNIDYMAVRAEVRSYLLCVGVPASVLSLNESIFEMLKKTEIFLKNNDKLRKTVETVRRNALAIADRFELEAAKNTSLLPGVTEALKMTKEMRLKIGLCTINGEKSTNYVLKRFGIRKYFNVIVPRNKARFVKPNVDHLQVTLKALRVKPEDALVVGDGVVDMRCSKELGTIAIGIPTGLSSSAELINTGADYIITSAAELPTIIKHINKSSETPKHR